MTEPAREQQHREEAERLALLPVEEQKQIIAMHRADANNPKVPKRDRAFAAERADALEWHFRRLRKKRKL